MLRCLIFSDLHLSIETADEVNEALEEQVLTEENLNQVDIVVLLGDIVDVREELNDKEKEMVSSTLELISSLVGEKPFVVCLGNHDEANYDWLYDEITELFNWPSLTDYGKYRIISGVYLSHNFRKRGKGFSAKNAKDIFDAVLHSSVSGHVHHFSVYEAKAMGKNSPVYTTVQCPSITRYTPWAGASSEQWAAGYLLATFKAGTIVDLTRRTLK